MECDEVVRDGDPGVRTPVGRSYLMQAQALSIAYGAIAYAIQCIENGNPGVLALEQLKRDRDMVKSLM
jgi:hypothetical protein